MPRKDLLDIASLDRAEIDHLLDQSVPFKELFTRSVKKVPALKGKSVLMLFYEPSTRTHSSFEVAAKRLSADVTNFDVAQSSITKGESVRETVETLQAMRTDFVIVRHKASGLPGTIARLTRASVINAGDGAHAHPTQALFDAFTIKEKFPDPAGKKVLIIGDILHSRVARSTSTILKKLGVQGRLPRPRIAGSQGRPGKHPPLHRLPRSHELASRMSSICCASRWNARTSSTSPACANTTNSTASPRPASPKSATAASTSCTPAR
jgi:aspartate carbamoyltransferase